MTDECYPLTLMMRLNVKGKAENIKGVHQDIKKFIQNLEVSIFFYKKKPKIFYFFSIFQKILNMLVFFFTKIL